MGTETQTEALGNFGRGLSSPGSGRGKACSCHSAWASCGAGPCSVPGPSSEPVAAPGALQCARSTHLLSSRPPAGSSWPEAQPGHCHQGLLPQFPGGASPALWLLGIRGTVPWWCGICPQRAREKGVCPGSPSSELRLNGR